MKLWATNTNVAVVEAGLEFGVKVYVFSPCIVCKFLGPLI